MKRIIKFISFSLFGIILSFILVIISPLVMIDWGLSATESSISEVPLHFTSSGNIKVSVEIDGVNYPFILDSGASNILFLNESTQGLIHSDIFKVKWIGFGLSSSGKAIFSKILGTDHISIGNSTLKNVRFNAIKFTPPKCDEGVLGIVGKEIMSNYSWYFDKASKTITFSNKSLDQIKFNTGITDTLPLLINPFSNHISAKIDIDDKFTKKVKVDLGFTGQVGIERDESIQFDSSRLRKIQGMASRDLRGSTGESQYYLAKSISFGRQGFALASNALTLVQEKRSNVMGLGILRKFNFIIDYENKLLILNKPENFNHLQSSKTFGFSIFLPKGSKPRVSYVVRGSQAEELGLKPNMTVQKINSQIIDESNYCSFKDTLFQKDTVLVEVEELNSILLIRKGDYLTISNGDIDLRN